MLDGGDDRACGGEQAAWGPERDEDGSIVLLRRGDEAALEISGGDGLDRVVHGELENCGVCLRPRSGRAKEEKGEEEEPQSAACVVLSNCAM